MEDYDKSQDPARGLQDCDESQDPTRGLEDCDESQDHLEVCPGYSELWLGLGSMSPLTRVRRVQNKRKKRVV